MTNTLYEIILFAGVKTETLPRIQHPRHGAQILESGHDARLCHPIFLHRVWQKWLKKPSSAKNTSVSDTQLETAIFWVI